VFTKNSNSTSCAPEMSIPEFAIRSNLAAIIGEHNARSMRGFGMEAKPQWKRRRRACDC